MVRLHCPKCESKNIIHFDWFTYKIDEHPDFNGLLHFVRNQSILPDCYCFGCQYYWMEDKPIDGYQGGIKTEYPKNDCSQNIL